jgi:hypothetical protein
LRPLDDAQRRRLLTRSALCCAISLCLAPLAGRSSFELAGEQAAFDSRFTALALQNVWNQKPVPISRDPFIPEASSIKANLGPQLGAGNDSIVGMQVTQGDPIGFTLPANRGAEGTPLQDGPLGTPRISAIVSGPSPRALVDDGTHVRVLAVGDALAGSRVTAIDESGVHLQSGALLRLAEDRL